MADQQLSSTTAAFATLGVLGNAVLYYNSLCKTTRPPSLLGHGPEMGSSSTPKKPVTEVAYDHGCWWPRGHRRALLPPPSLRSCMKSYLPTRCFLRTMQRLCKRAGVVEMSPTRCWTSAIGIMTSTERASSRRTLTCKADWKCSQNSALCVDSVAKGLVSS